MRIYDDLYGLIEFEDREKEVIDHGYFQRLRRIQQLALAHYVFPGATHTRFSHSLGVAHLMNQLLECIDPAAKFINRDVRSQLRMAALLHDVGHLPLSHSLEQAYHPEYRQALTESMKERETSLLPNEERKRAKRPKVSPQLRRLIEASPANESEDGRIQLHEILSRLVITDSPLTSKLELQSYDVEEIASMVVGKHREVHLNQLMHSHLDVDKMDYLLRDAKATGINYGLYNQSYLTHNIRIHHKFGVLYVDEKALHTAEHFVLANYFYYLQLLYHKKRDAYERLAALCARWMIEEDLLPSLEELPGCIRDGSFAELDDPHFVSKLREYRQNLRSNSIKFKVASIILDRKHVNSLSAERVMDWSGSDPHDLVRGKFPAEYDKAVDGNVLESMVLKKSRFSPDVSEAVHFYEHPETSRKRCPERGPEYYPDTIKVSVSGSLKPINEMSESVISKLAALKTVLNRYYYVHHSDL